MQRPWRWAEIRARAAALLKAMPFPFHTGTAGAAMIESLQVFTDALFWHASPLPIPTGLLIDAEGRLAVLYRGPVSTDQLLQDAATLDEPEQDWFARSLPFPGRSYGRPGDKGLAHVGMRMADQGRSDLAAGYLRENEQLLRSRFESGGERHLPAALYNLGVEAGESGKQEEAARIYNEVLTLDPNYAAAHFNLGLLEAEKPDYVKAERHYEEAVRADPYHFDALNNLGLLRSSNGDLDGAISFFERGLEVVPQHLDILNNLGNTLVALGRWDEALARLQEAEKVDSRDSRTQFNLGVACPHEGYERHESGTACQRDQGCGDLPQKGGPA